MQGVEQLPLVSMQTLGLNVKDGIRIDLDAAAVFDQLRQDFLALMLDLQKLDVYKRQALRSSLSAVGRSQPSP